ncbi:MAG: hypothetical protein KF819_03155 [Labilithrix sp.]|nr:hypothetical protein [Labilithrix sp.]
MIRRRFTSFVVALVVPALVCLASCEEGETAQACTDIPAGGCPLSRGRACQDPACEASYACRPGNVWELSEVCPPRADAGRPDVAIADAFDAPSYDASFDAPPGAHGGPGCGLLQAPDCSLGFALACPSGCCECDELFVCENGGWNAWGTCVDGVGIKPN